MRRSGKPVFQLLVCFVLCIVATLSFAGSKDVIVANPDSQPVPVKNVENPDKLPRLLSTYEMHFAVGENQKTGYMGYVPAGKRWVIEHVSAIAKMPLGQVPMVSVLIYGGTISGNVHWVIFQPQGDQYYIASQPLKLRLEGGELLALNFWRSSTDSAADVSVYVSGYEIDYP